MGTPRIIIGGAGSGSGKTTVTCALLSALKNRGLSVSAVKCGPDYLDPMFHKRALGISSMNLDLFFLNRETACGLLTEHSAASDICVIEGVMGYYDGMAFDTAKGSTYDIALSTATPAVIVINAKGMALTLAAVVKGIKDYRENSMVRAVILNNVSEGVYKQAKKIIEAETGVKVIGYMPHDDKCSVDSRHLGLTVPDGETENKIKLLGETAEKTIDIDALLSVAKESEPLDFAAYKAEINAKVKIAVAYDEAFCFYYSENLKLLENMGAEIRFFSPVHDSAVPDDADGIILGGGYPELFADRLSENKDMLKSIKDSIESGMPCLAECGGFMYLCSFVDGHETAGIFNAKAKNSGRLSRFGYIELKSDIDYINGIKGHEFHYWDTDNNGNVCTAVKPSGRSWQCMHIYKNTIAGYPHLYYYSKPEFAKEFILKCADWRK